jgi:hypothetical protein
MQIYHPCCRVGCVGAAGFTVKGVFAFLRGMRDVCCNVLQVLRIMIDWWAAGTWLCVYWHNLVGHVYNNTVCACILRGAAPA